MARILVLNPVSTSRWDEVTRKHLERVADPRTEFEVRSLRGGPKSIESEYDSVLAARYVVEEAVRAEREGFDAMVINCFDDPGLHASREVVDMLVLGIGESSMLLGILLGHRIAVISTGRSARSLYHKKAMELGIAERLAYSSGIDVGVLELREREGEIEEMIKSEARRAIEAYGAEVIVLGCGGFIGLPERLSKELGVPVIDATLATFKLAEALASLNLSHSKAFLYNPPPHKLYEWRRSLRRPH